MNKIIDYFTKNSFVVNLITVFILIVGFISLSSMRRGLIPPLEFQSISIRVNMLGASPAEIEKFITYPIEENLKGLPGVERIESKSFFGRSRIKLHYPASYNKMDRSVENVRTRVNSIRSRLPSNLRSLTVTKDSKDDEFLFFLGLEGFVESNTEHRQFYKDFDKALNRVDGVVRIYSNIRARDIYVEFHKEKLLHHQISISEVRSQISQSLNFTPIGQIKVKNEDYSVSFANVSDSLKSIEALPISSNRIGNTLLLKDIAKVRYKLAKTDTTSYLNGKPTINMWVNKSLTTDSINVRDKAMKLVHEFNKKAPEGLIIRNLMDGTKLIEGQLEVLKKSGFIGFVIVLIILMIFLNWRTALMTTLGLPLAYCGTMIVLHAMGISFDLLSIIGMILVIGILVDDAIIVSERYIENLEDGLSPLVSAQMAVKKLIVPVTGTVLTTIVAFSPMILIKSEIGMILMAIPLVVIFSLIFSWLESFFLLPNHLQHFAPQSRAPIGEKFLVKLREKYETALRLSLKFRYAIFLALILSMGGAGYLAMNKIEHNFNLRIEPEYVYVFAKLKQAESPEQALKTIKPISEFLKKLPESEVENTKVNIGSIWHNGHVMKGSKYVKIVAYLNQNDRYPSKLKEKVSQKVEKFIASLDQKAFEKIETKAEGNQGREKKEKTITVEVRGNENINYNDIESSLDKRITSLDTIKEYVPDPEILQEKWEFEPNHKALLQYQVAPSQVAQQVRGIFTPDEVKEVRIEGERIFIYTKLFGVDDDLNFKTLGNFEVMSNRGSSIPLAFLGEWKRTRDLKKISHYDLERNLRFDFKFNKDNKEKLSLTAAQAQVKESIASLDKEFPSYSFKVIDTQIEETKSRAWAIKVTILCLGSVLLILALILKSLTQPFLVGLPIPFGLVGVILALYIHGLPMGLMALIGLVGIIGVSVNDSIVMMDKINSLAGKSSLIDREHIVKGASSRLRAIILTTVTTLGGVFPMAYSIGGESGFTQPLAFSMGWGLSFSTILTLFFLPSLLVMRNDLIKAMTWIKNKFITPKPLLNQNSKPIFVEDLSAGLSKRNQRNDKRDH